MFYREAGQFKTSYRQDMAVLPVLQDRIAIFAIVAAAFVVVPMFATQYLLQGILIPTLILALAAIGLNILVGYCGQVSLGSGAFMAIGAYAAYNFAIRIPDMPLIFAILLGGLSAAVVGIAFGIPSLRIKGFYLAVATLAAQFFFDWLFLRVGWFSNNTPSGSVNAPRLDVFGWFVNTPAEKYLLVLGFLVVAAVVAKNMVRGHVGRQWMAIRDMDIAAEIIGIRPMYAKLSAFAVSSFFIGVAGALWAFVHLGSWEPLAFSIDRSFQILFAVIIGGLGSIAGGILGAAFMWILPIFLEIVLPVLGGWVGWQIDKATVSHFAFMIFGALIVILLIAEPHGIARLWSIMREKLRLWPFPH